MKLIPKDALVAEIERRKKKNLLNEGAFEEDIDILSFINTLEVKEVDLDYIRKELDELIRFNKPDGDFGWGTLYNIAEHFFELGVNASNPLETDLETEQRIKECPFREVICNRYEDNPIECDGRCSWAVDYLKLKRFKAQKKEKV